MGARSSVPTLSSSIFFENEKDEVEKGIEMDAAVGRAVIDEMEGEIWGL